MHPPGGWRASEQPEEETRASGVSTTHLETSQLPVRERKRIPSRGREGDGKQFTREMVLCVIWGHVYVCRNGHCCLHRGGHSGGGKGRGLVSAAGLWAPCV